MQKIDALKFDHVAVTSKNISDSLAWYSERFELKVIYQDETWALISIGGAKIAFVMEQQHPPHVCFNVDMSSFKFDESKFKEHRDGSRSEYIEDLDGNFIELLKWK